MDPTLEVGDVLLVDKVTPRLFRGTASQKVGDVVLFHPPQKLQEIVSRSGAGKPLGDRDLFVKRIAAVAGDVVTVRANGQVLVNDRADGRNRDLCAGPGVESYLEPGNLELKPGEVAVLGDCARVSIDSRVWGPLPSGDIVGRPLLRLWPISRFGSIPSLPLKDL
jgi:signal peptidase I